MLFSFFYKANELSNHQREVAMLQPFTRKDLMIRSLPDRISDCLQVSTSIRLDTITMQIKKK